MNKRFLFCVTTLLLASFIVVASATAQTVATVEKLWSGEPLGWSTADSRQWTGYGEYVYWMDKAKHAIVGTKDGVKVDTVLVNNKLKGVGFCVDDAGNWIAESNFLTYEPIRLMLVKRSDKTIVEIEITGLGRTDMITATGDVFSTDGGVVFLYGNNVNLLAVSIKNAGQNSQEVKTKEIAVKGSGVQNYVVAGDMTNQYAQRRSAGQTGFDYYENGVNKGSIEGLTGYKQTTLSGAMVTLAGKTFAIYPAGTQNYSSEFSVANLTDGVLAVDKTDATKTVFYANTTTRWNSTDVGVYVNATKIDNNNAYIQVGNGADGTALFRLNVPVTAEVTVLCDEKKGTVSSGGDFPVGTKITISAEAKPGYQFVAWTNGTEIVSTNATYSFIVAENISLSAIFNTASIMNVMPFGLKSTQNNDSVTIEYSLNTSASELVIEIFDAQNDECVETITLNDVSLLTAGKHQTTINIPFFDDLDEGAYNWAIHAYGNDVEFSNVLPIGDPRYSFHLPQDIVVDNSFDSDFFGRIYLSESCDGTSDGGSDVTKIQKRGLFYLDPLLNTINGVDSALVGFDGGLGGNRTNRMGFKRLAVDEKGYVYVASRDDATMGVYRADPSNLANPFVSILRGSNTIDALELFNGNLYTFEGLNSNGNPSYFKTYDMTSIPIIGESSSKNASQMGFVNPDATIRADHHGGFWGIQYRYSLDSYNAIAHWDATGKVDFAVNSQANTGLLSNSNGSLTCRGALGVNIDGSLLAISSNKQVVIFSVYWNDNGVPSLTELLKTPVIGNNIDGIAFDAANNLYIASSSTEQLYLYPFSYWKGSNHCRVYAPRKYMIFSPEIISGKDNSWSYNAKTHTLSIFTIGDMQNYNKNSLSPWSPFADFITSVILPDGLTGIGDYAFYGCNNLTSVTLPNSIKYIGQYAFANCGLTSVIFSNDILVCDYAYYGCSCLTSVTIPESMEIPPGYHSFYCCNNLISVTINSNAVTDYYIFEVEGLNWSFKDFFGPQVKEYIIGKEVSSIAKGAFRNCSNIETLSLGKNISIYGANAFAGCPNIRTIYNYRERPAKLGTGTFKDVDYFNCTLYVLAGSVDMYKSSGSDWKDFYFIEPIGATSVTTDKVEVSVTDNSAIVTWPFVENAETFELMITDKYGQPVCTLIFNSQGKLANIAFAAPGRTQSSVQSAGFSFTVTGLDSGTRYSLTLNAKDDQGTVLQSTTQSFTTTGGVATDAGLVEFSAMHGRATKLIRNGQLFILRDGKTYTAQGQEVR